MKSEAKVGLFVFVSFLFLFFLTTQVGTFKNLSKDGYTIYSKLDNAAGLDKNAKVKANGIDVGYIENLSIDGNKVLAKLYIFDGTKIPENSTFKATQGSMLGGKYGDIVLGDSQNLLALGSQIQSAPALADINQASDSMAKAADEFKLFISEFREVMDGDARRNLTMTFQNLENITKELKDFVKLDTLNNTTNNFNDMAKNLSETGKSFTKLSNKFSLTADMINGKLPKILTKIDKLVSDLKVASATFKEKIPHLSAKFENIENELSSIIAKNKDPLNNTITSAEDFFDEGSETFRKVDDLLETINKVKLEVAMHTESMSNDSYTKGYLDLNYIPSDTKQYQFSVVGMDDYSRLDDDGSLIKPKKHEESKLLISAQLAKRYSDVVLRTGVIENSVGAGVDYYMFNDDFKASAQIHDFNAEYDVRGDKAHAKVSARYTFLKHLDIYGGYDNFLNDETKNAFVGVGIRFYDDDLKKLIMSQSLGSFAN